MFSGTRGKSVAIASVCVPILSYLLYFRLYKHTAIMPEKKPFERLPKDIIPVNYVLRLQPDIKGFTFDGHEEITVKVRNQFDPSFCETWSLMYALIIW